MSAAIPTIVIVDDAPEVRQLMRTRLRLSGKFEVVGEGADGHEAIDLAARHKPALLLLDVSMPKVDGLEALPGILEVSPRTRVVLFSGFEEEHGLVKQAHKLGAAAFVEKSVPIESLIGRLLDVADDSRSPERPADSEAAPPPRDASVLDEHLERFREVFDEAAIGMATMTLTGRLVRVNRALAGLVGRPEGDLVGEQYVRLVDDPDGVVQRTLERIRSGQVDVVHFEHDITGAATPRKVRATLAPVRDSAGRALYVFMQLQDVTSEQAALEQLRRSEERFRLLVETVEDYAIFMLDPGGHIVSWNAGAQRSKLYTAEQIIGKHFRVFYPPELQASRHPEFELEAAIRDGHYEEEGWRIRRDGSRFWASVVITAVFNEDGVHIGFAKVTRDTTQRRRLEQDRESALKALAQANRELESLNGRLRQSADDQAEFLAVTAHELRTPIGLLSGSAETLSRHSDELTGEERDELLAAMASGSARLRRLVADLLTAAKLQSSEFEMKRQPTRLSSVLTEAVTTVRSSYPGAELRVAGPSDLVVSADRDRLAQTLENLLLNALRHGEPPVAVTFSADHDMVRVRVCDSGTGVAPEMRSRLFERFTSGPARGGTGLGLYIVRQLARAHHGEAFYEPPTPSDPAGAFVLELPLTAADPHDEN
jgi:PAS domain S-box-containing protein